MNCEDCIHEKVCEGYSNCEEVGLCEPNRPHGEWIETGVTDIYNIYNKEYKCSICDGRIFTFSNGYNFCPDCGADMRTQNDRSWDTSERGVSGSVKNSIAQEEGKEK